MATIQGKIDERIFNLTTFLGLRENPDGDTKLKLGEASVCQNWKVTRDKNLRRRNGYAVTAALGTGKVQGLWSGIIDGNHEMLAACDGHLWKLWDYNGGELYESPVDLGLIDTANRVNFFEFGGKLYMLNGVEYMEYDGDRLRLVEGYRPLIYTSLTPAGEQPQGGSMLEEINKLTGARRVQYSPDGTATTFQLPETDLLALDYVMYTASGAMVAPTDYTFDRIAGTVEFDTAPVSGTNTIEIGYSAVSTYREQVTRMTNFEMYSGNTDMRVFIYGDGSNKALYSSIDYDGRERADYFPDLNEMAVGESNTPLTALVRHYSTMVAYKTNGTYSVTYGLVQLADGSQEAGFYVIPINKLIGNVALGQVRLVLNAPYTLFGKDLYEWRSNSYYNSSLGKDERQARRVSDRIYSTLGEFDAPNCYCFDDDYEQEYYICNPATAEALVWNYAADAWYFFNHFPMNCATRFGDSLYLGSTDGRILKYNEAYYNDAGEAFESRWESGSIDFGRPYERKYSNEMWIGIKPESRGHVGVTIRTDKKSNFATKDTDSYLMDFWDIDFRDFSFNVNRSPQIRKHKLKAKKYVYWKLILVSDDDVTGATVLDANVKVRYIGYAK